MLALWIAIAVVVVVALATVAAVGVRQRRRGPAPTTPPKERPGRGPAPTAPPRGAPPPAPPSRAGPAPGAPEGQRGEGAGTVVEEPPAAPAPEAPPEVEPHVEVEAPAAPPRFRDRLGKARGMLAGYLGSVRGRDTVDAATWDELEEALIRADVGVATATSVLEDLQARVKQKALKTPDEVLEALRQDVLSTLTTPATAAQTNGAHDAQGAPVATYDRSLQFAAEPDCTNVWLFVGVNGVGKTTTVGKLARQQRLAGRSVLLAAGDTFRAAAGEQLAQWAERSGAEIVRGAEGGDPSAIVFDAVQRAAARGNDLVLADTAGRLHTKVNLVEELKKIRRVADRPPGKVTEVLLVLDATTGQNALVQARQFTEAVGVTGVVLTKLDGTAKGGVVVAIQQELGLPVKLVGLGEGPDDLVAFDPDDFVEALLG